MKTGVTIIIHFVSLIQIAASCFVICPLQHVPILVEFVRNKYSYLVCEEKIFSMRFLFKKKKKEIKKKFKPTDHRYFKDQRKYIKSRNSMENLLKLGMLMNMKIMHES